MTAIVIGIPTFRRPRQLDALLASLGAGARRRPTSPSSSPTTPARPPRWRSPSATTPAIARCPSAGSPRSATRSSPRPAGLAPGWRWLAMLDDDGRVAPGWLAPLVACGETLRARISSAARSKASCRPTPGGWRATASSPAAAAPRPGAVATLNGAQNLMIARGLVDLLGTPLFRARLRPLGGRGLRPLPARRRGRRPHGLVRRGGGDRAGAAGAAARRGGCWRATIRPASTRARIDRGVRRGGRGPGRAALKGLAGAAARGAAAGLRGDLRRRGRRGADARPLRRPRRRAARRRERALRRAMTGRRPPARRRGDRAGAARPAAARALPPAARLRDRPRLPHRHAEPHRLPQPAPRAPAR